MSCQSREKTQRQVNCQTGKEALLKRLHEVRCQFLPEKAKGNRTSQWVPGAEGRGGGVGGRQGAFRAGKLFCTVPQ